MFLNDSEVFKAIDDSSFVEVEVFLSPLDHCLVGLVEVLLCDHVSILSHGFHTSLLTDTGDICSTDLVRTTHVLLQVHVF